MNYNLHIVDPAGKIIGRLPLAKDVLRKGDMLSPEQEDLIDCIKTCIDNAEIVAADKCEWRTGNGQCGVTPTFGKVTLYAIGDPEVFVCKRHYNMYHGGKR